MDYLVVSILFMGLLSLFMRYSLGRGADPLSLNFVFRGAVALFLLLPHLDNLTNLLARWEASALLTTVAALSFWLSGLASLKAVQLGPLGASWTILRCAMVLPVLASILYWGELSSSASTLYAALRLGGVVLAFATVIFYGLASRGRRPGVTSRNGWTAWMAAAFLSQGIWEICLRATADFHHNESRALFLLGVFAFSSLFTLPVMLWTRTRLRTLEIGYGFLLGGCALLGTGTRVLALRDVPGTIVFPLTTISVIFITQAAGRFLWGEKIRHGGIGLIMGLVAALLLTL
ncbi:MAG: hypothetical protein O2954_06940 [bacterium]|nr:hypothetical protein [bacterium]